MKIGPIIVLISMLANALTVITSIVMAVRRGASSLKFAMPMFAGALMLYGFISAGIGISEGVWAVTSTGFIVACTVGAAGIALMVLGVRGISRSNGRPSPTSE